MKVKVEIWYPVESTYREEVEIDVPDGENVEDYIYENQAKILEENGAEVPGGDMVNALDYDYAGVKLLEAAAEQE